MSIRSNYREQIESYFNGEMQGADRLVFEGRVASNPALKEEFEIQDQIVESLKAQRKAELKTRLNSISVEPSLLGSLIQSSLIKPMAYAVTGLAITVGSYVYYDSQEEFIYHIDNINSKSSYLTDMVVDVSDQYELNYRYKHEVSTVLESVEKEDQLLADQTLGVKKEIQFEVPDIGDQVSKDDFVGSTMPVFEGAKGINQVPSVSKIDKVNIQTIYSRRYDFHYRMEDNRLYLYGKFNESPYEIIEINSPGSKKLFFYYDGEFFGLNKNAASVTPLSKIQNQNTIEELLTIKNNTTL